MKRNVKLYIKDIIEYMERAEEYVKDLKFEQFAEDKKTYDAVLRSIERLQKFHGVIWQE
jgi:uncharacterized protein with HEPN domain